MILSMRLKNPWKLDLKNNEILIRPFLCTLLHVSKHIVWVNFNCFWIGHHRTYIMYICRKFIQRYALGQLPHIWHLPWNLAYKNSYFVNIFQGFSPGHHPMFSLNPAWSVAIKPAWQLFAQEIEMAPDRMAPTRHLGDHATKTLIRLWGCNWGHEP